MKTDCLKVSLLQNCLACDTAHAISVIHKTFQFSLGAVLLQILLIAILLVFEIGKWKRGVDLGSMLFRQM